MGHYSKVLVKDKGHSPNRINNINKKQLKVYKTHIRQNQKSIYLLSIDYHFHLGGHG